MSLSVIRDAHPRLYHPADDPDYRFAPPGDPVRQRILKNILEDCETFASHKPWKRIPERPDSPHPFHQLYLTFYTGMHATTLIEHYAFAWRLTGDRRWLSQAKRWLSAACKWEHSDRVEEHFYTANRYMHAFAFALDLLTGQLTTREEERVTECLIRLMQRWWPEVEEHRHASEGGHHAVVDNGHLGVAAIHLLGRHPEAPAWVEAVVDRFRSGIMPNGCGRDGEPVDGPSFWPWENLWMLHFADALRNVVGIDLYREFPQRLSRPLKWFRYHLVGSDQSLGAGRMEVWSPTLLRLAQEAGDGELHRVALGDPHLGRIYRFGAGAKGSTAECMIAYGPYAYCYCAPDFKPRRRRGALARSRKFTQARYGETALLRSGWDACALIVQVSGYRGGAVHGFSNLHLHWAGHPVLKTISCEEARPVACGNLPCVGGQNEFVAHLGALERKETFDRLSVRSTRVDHEYWLLRADPPMLLVALRRKSRGVKIIQERREPFVRLSGKDYLQYPRKPYFNPSAGQLRMRVRLRREVDLERPQILFNTGIGIAGVMGTQVNNFTLGFFGGEGLTFAVQSQRYNKVEVRIPPEEATMEPGKWHDLAIAWGGFNDPEGKPFIEVALDGCRQRCDDVALFGELGSDTQHLRSRTTPRTFRIEPNTLLAFGAAIQMPDTGTACDIARIELKCPKRKSLMLAFEDDAVGASKLGDETGGRPLVWKLNPIDLKEIASTHMLLGAGSRTMAVLPVYPKHISFDREVVPFAPSGLAASSLKNLKQEADRPATRVLVSTEQGDMLVLAFVDGSAQVQIVEEPNGFRLETAASRYAFKINPKGGDLLILC